MGIPEEVQRGQMAVAWLTAALLVCNADWAKAVESVVRYACRAIGNWTRTGIADPIGILVCTRNRIFDALSCLQNIVLPQ